MAYFLEEYSSVAHKAGSAINAAAVPVATQTSAFTTEEQTAVFDAATEFITIHADEAMKLALGTNPDAENDTVVIDIPAGTHRSFQVPPGQNYRGSVWDGSS